MKLAKLATKYNSAKSSLDGMLEFYDRHFYDIRREIKNVLEIGVGVNATSLNMWAEYFPNARICGIDN